tara:strand:- start:1050 stop:1223 length:174 start_codon:yes stop_codon:yes gene_type:complete
MCRPKDRKFYPPPDWPTRPDGRPMTQNDILLGLVIHDLQQADARERPRPRRCGCDTH